MGRAVKTEEQSWEYAFDWKVRDSDPLNKMSIFGVCVFLYLYLLCQDRT